VVAAVIALALLVGNPWRKVMPDGTKVTLYAITHMSPKRSWSPDGVPLATCVLPPRQLGCTKPRKGEVTAFFRIESAPNRHPTAARVYLERVSMFDGADLMPAGGKVVNVSIAFRNLEPRKGMEKGTIRLGLALPPSLRQQVSPRLNSTPEGLSVTIGKDRIRDLTSAVLYDRNGVLSDKWVDLEATLTDRRTIHAQPASFDFAKGNQFREFSFQSSKVQRVFLVTRPFIWTTFVDVHLRPSASVHRF
jgi:hypothetical protein